MTEIDIPSAGHARVLTDRIKVAVEGTWLLIQEAYTSRAWAALGYESWDAYCSTEFGQTRLALPREERREVVASLRDLGLSVRAIASATGADKNTVMTDLRQVSEIQTPEVTGTDGKTYTAGRPEPEAPKPKRRPLPEAFTDAGRDLTRAAERLARLTEDDRFARNRETARHQVPELLAALDYTARLVTAMDLPAAEASEEARRWWATSLSTISDALRGVADSIE